MIVRIIQGSIEPANEKGTQYEEKYEGPYGALIVLVVVVLPAATIVLAVVVVVSLRSSFTFSLCLSCLGSFCHGVILLTGALGFGAWVLDP